MRNRIPEDHWLRTAPVAHRGLHGGAAAENSLTAYRRACDRGYPIEIDVHLTADGEIAVFHDDTLDRVCGVSGRVSDFTAAELGKLKLSGTEDTIPMLAAVLETVSGRVPLLIEIKDHADLGELEEKLVLALRAYRGEFAIQSFNPFILKKLRRLAPDFLRGQLAAWEYPDLPKWKASFLRTLRSRILSRPDFVSYDVTALPNRFVSSKKYTLLCWTVKTEAAEEKTYALGANLIFEGFLPSGKRATAQNER